MFLMGASSFTVADLVLDGHLVAMIIASDFTVVVLEITMVLADHPLLFLPLIHCASVVCTQMSKSTFR